MRSGVRCGSATTIALAASGAANSADLESAVQRPSPTRSWSGGYIGGHVRGSCGQKCFSNPEIPSVHGGGVDTPVFLSGDQIGYNAQNNSWVFGFKRDARGAVSNCTNACLAASGTALNADCKATLSLFITGADRLGYALDTQGQTLAHLRGGVAWRSSRGKVISSDEFTQCRRRRARPLQDARRDLSRHRAPAMLGAQDRERQSSALCAGHHEEGFARGLFGANRASAEALIDVFADKYCARHARAFEYLVEDRNAPLAFHHFVRTGPLADHQFHRERVSPPGNTGPCGRRAP